MTLIPSPADIFLSSVSFESSKDVSSSCLGSPVGNHRVASSTCPQIPLPSPKLSQRNICSVPATHFDFDEPSDLFSSDCFSDQSNFVETPDLQVPSSNFAETPNNQVPSSMGSQIQTCRDSKNVLLPSTSSAAPFLDKPGSPSPLPMLPIPGTELAGVDCNGLEEAGVQMGIKVRGLDLMRYGRLENGVFRCTECEKMNISKTFKTSYSFQRHAYLYHEGLPKRFPCPVCQKEFSRPDKRKSHLKEKHGLFHHEPIEHMLDFSTHV